jgi:HKD family nuclease
VDIDIELLGNSEAKALGPRLQQDLAECRRASIAVAFAKRSALQQIDLDQWCSDGGQLRLVAGTDFALTELDLLKTLSSHTDVDCRVFHQTGDKRVFHPKLYVLEQPKQCVAYVGSANLTGGGLRGNFESVVRLAGPSDHPSLTAAALMFAGYFDSEFAAPIDPEFEVRYRALQQARNEAERERWQLPEMQRFVAEERLALVDYRAAATRQKRPRWLLVTTPDNYAICMNAGMWGRQRQSEIEAYQRGDLFFFHVSEQSVTKALGMFVDAPFYDETPLWPADARGSFPWRIRFVVLGELRAGLRTRDVLAPLRPSAPRGWFSGFAQASHSLNAADFDALLVGFREALRLQNGLVGVSRK